MLGRHALLQGLMRALLVVVLHKGIELHLQCRFVRRRLFAQGMLERAVHPLVATVFLWHTTTTSARMRPCSKACRPSITATRPGHTPQSYRSCSTRSIGNEFESATDRKSTRLNSSHSQISYAVFCLKKKKARRDHAPRAVSRG